MARRLSASPRAVARSATRRSALQYQLRIELQHIEPLIWPRVLVPGDVTLANLRLILQGAMGWHGGHLHEYEIARPRPPLEEDKISRGPRHQAGVAFFDLLVLVRRPG